MVPGLKNINIVNVIQGAGVNLVQRGTRHVGLCPFHSEATPSFTVFEDNRFHCFGCHEHGDAIDFIKKNYNCSFREALRHLGLDQKIPSYELSKQIQKKKRKRVLLNKFYDWQNRYVDELGILICAGHRVLSQIKTVEDFNRFSPLYDGLVKWEAHLWLLIYGDDEDRFELFKEVGDRDHYPKIS